MTVNLDIKLNIPDLGVKDAPCERVEGHEAISEPYRFEVAFVSDVDLSSRTVAGKPAWVSVSAYSNPDMFVGVILEFRVKDKTSVNQFNYSLVIGPRLSLLGYSRQTEVFATQDAIGVKALLKGILDDTLSSGSTTGGHGQKLDYVFNDTVKDSYSRKNITKYNESDLDFFSRTAENYGIFYFATWFAEGGKYKDSFTMGSGNTAFTEGPNIPFNVPSTAFATDTASVVSFFKVQRPKFKQFKLRDYNEAQPSSDMLATSSADKTGVAAVVEYGDHYPNQTEGNLLAAIRADELAWQTGVFEGESTVTSLRAGKTFTLTSHPIPEFNAKYVVVSVVHSAELASAQGFSDTTAQSQYRNRFVAIPYTQTFRPKRQTPRPVMSGVFNAMVDASGSPKRAVLESDGTYRVTFRYNEGKSRKDDNAGKRSAPVRQIQPYAGASANGVVSGLHIPLVKNAEVLMSYVNGDPDRPVIVGAAFNGTNADVVNGSSQTVNRLRTTAGTLLEMFDAASDSDGRYLRMDVPANVGDNPPSGTYFRLGNSSGSDEGSAKSGLTYTASTSSSTEESAASKNNNGFGDASSGKGSTSEASVTVTTGAATNSSGNGILLYTKDDLDVNIAGAALKKYGKGYTTKTATGDSTHTVDTGIYKLTTKSGVSINAGMGNLADIKLTASNAVKTTSEGPQSFFTYGTLTKYTVGESFTMFFGLEQTIKASISITLQLSGVSTITIGLNTSMTLGMKADMIIGLSRKVCLGGDYKLATSDSKLLAGNDMKIAFQDTKLLAWADVKICAYSATTETLKDDQNLTALKAHSLSVAQSALDTANKGLSSKFVKFCESIF